MGWYNIQFLTKADNSVHGDSGKRRFMYIAKFVQKRFLTMLQFISGSFRKALKIRLTRLVKEK